MIYRERLPENHPENIFDYYILFGDSVIILYSQGYLENDLENEKYIFEDYKRWFSKHNRETIIKMVSEGSLEPIRFGDIPILASKELTVQEIAELKLYDTEK